MGFLIAVLEKFGFNQVFCDWILTILNSANISICVNGKQEGYFKCRRGVRQGDPLSPLLLCIAEEVLSRGITKLVDEGKIDITSASRHENIPSHSMYADDIMVYCKGKMSSLEGLKDLFTSYANCSGQIISVSKSSIFSGVINHNRLLSIVEFLGFSIATLPFTYLVVPIFKGKP